MLPRANPIEGLDIALLPSLTCQNASSKRLKPLLGTKKKGTSLRSFLFEIWYVIDSLY
jgi:hypothetical protein